MPPGRKITTAVSAMPKPISSTSPVAPGTIFGISRPRPSSSPSTASAPTTAPQTVPRPPSTEISRNFTDSGKLAAFGFTTASQCANAVPATDAYAAESTSTCSRSR